MAPNKNSKEPINELEKEKKQIIENLEVKIQQKADKKEIAYSIYQKEKADEKMLENELNLIKKLDVGQKALNHNKKEYIKPNKDEIQEVVQEIVDGVITRSEGADTLGIPYSTMCRHVQNTGIKVPSRYYYLPEVSDSGLNEF